MSRADVRDDIRMRIAEDEANFWTQPDIDRIINWAHRQAVALIRPWMYMRTFMFDSQADIDEYDEGNVELPADILLILGVTWGNPDGNTYYRPLTFMSRVDMDLHYGGLTKSSSTPLHYCMIGRAAALFTPKIVIRPAPSKAYTNGFRVVMLERPPDWTSDNQRAKVKEIEDAMGALGAFRCYKMQGGQFLKNAKTAWEEAAWLAQQAAKTCGEEDTQSPGEAWNYEYDDILLP